MRISSQLLLTFLLNACWQIALIAAFASIGSRIIRDASIRFRHAIWLGALVLSFIVPVITASRFQLDTIPVSTPAQIEQGPPTIGQRTITTESSLATRSAPAVFLLGRTMGLFLLISYLLFVVYRSFKLALAWRMTRQLRLSAIEINLNDRVEDIVRTCEAALSSSVKPNKVAVLSSNSVPVPITVGLFRPVIILPNELVLNSNHELLLSAIGHEFIHVARRDYLFNLICEVLYVPISFHPAAALIRRRIKQTRELCCDELVAELIVNPEVYARSLIKLASSAPTLRRLSVSTTVGIADADILEARIMSLLRKTKTNKRWKVMFIAVPVLLAIPCVAAAAFAMKFDLAQQEPSQEQKERRERETTETRMRAYNTESLEMKQRMDADPRFREEVMRKREMEVEMRTIRQAALARLAKINMDQAIQIASSQNAGKVLECTLDASHWEEPGKLADDGVVFYRVVILNEDPNGGSTHVWVNAMDGNIIKTEKELPRKQRRSEQR